MSRLRVAFAGHARPEDLGEVSLIESSLRAMFDLLKASGFDRGRLVTGLANGADLLAARAWAQADLGPIHAILPFLEDEPQSEVRALVASAAWLDGARAAAEGRNPHLMQARWLIEDADLLIVVWTGEAGRGAGGTSDSVRLALERGVPVAWIEPRPGQALRLICPGALEADFGFLEFLEQLQAGCEPLVTAATPARLKQMLSAPEAGTPDLSDLKGEAPGLLQRGFDALLDRTIWRTFALYKRKVGGRVAVEPGPELPQSLGAQPGFRILSEAYAAADRRANRLSSVHRSQQVFQAALMLLAAAIGSAPAVWPQIKIYSVLTELSVALLALAVWSGAMRSERGRRWGEARRLAEQLRLERAAWPLGLSTRDDRRFGVTSEPGRAAWRWRQAATPPDGPYDRTRVGEWGGWALDALVTGQIAYHRAQGLLNSRLAHRSHKVESVIFFAFILVLFGYAAAWGAVWMWRSELPHWLGGVVMMAGTVTPAFGAASLALDAALAFSDQGRRNAYMVRELSAIAATVPEDASLEALQRVARAAVRLQVSQEERWIDDAAHRHVVRA